VTTENITVLFTDLVGSTQLQSSVAPEEADGIRRDHFTVLRQAVAESGGREVKNLGDGLMVVFGSASAALACAVAMQQGVEVDGRVRAQDIGLRVGLAGGEVTREDDDYFGEPVIEAARLCARCEGGQILASDLVRLMAGRRNPHTTTTVGALELKGLPDPVDTVEVRWEPLGGAAAGGAALPGLLTESGRFPFAGRRKEAELLLGAYRTVTTGATRLVLIAGEPGIGKTRLTSELAGQVLGAGGTVLAGRSDELVGAPYQPFVEALRWQIAQPGGVDTLGAGAGELVRLVPELSHIVPDVRPPITAAPEAERLALFEAVRSWLAARAGEQPVLLVLDDLHWADMGTLLLLRHVIANDPVPRLLVVSTYRDTDLDRTHPLSSVLAEFHRRGDVDRIALSGLDEREVEDLMVKTAGHDLDEAGTALALSLQEDTGGNPFFVGEVLRHLAESGTIAQEGGRWVAARVDGDTYLPEGIRQVIGRRLSVLPEDTQKVLSSASVIGARFDLDLLAAVTGTTADEVVDAVEPGLDAHLVLETGFGRYQFAHALVRSTLQGELSTTRRGRLHLAVARALEEIHADDLDAVMADLAYHWGEAGAANQDDAAFTYARRAAELAAERVAPDEAVRWYRIARERLDGADPALDADLLCQLGKAEALAAEPRWQKTLLDSARAAERLGDIPLMAEALSVEMRTSIEMLAWDADLEKIELLERALSAVGDDPALAGQLELTLSSELTYTGEFERRARHFDRAVAHLDRIDDPLENMRIYSRGASGTPFTGITREYLELRGGRYESGLRQALALPDLEMAVEFLNAMTWWSLWLGTAEADDPIDRMDQVLAEAPNPLQAIDLEARKAHRALRAGLVAEASAYTDTMSRAATTLGIGDTRGYRGLAMLQQVRETDGVGAVVDVLQRDPNLEVERERGVPGVRTALLAWALADAGRLDEAADLVRTNSGRGFTDMPDEAALPITRVAWAEAAVLVGDGDACAALTDRLLPFHDIFQVSGGWYAGSTARYLAILSVALGDDDGAEEWFARAEADHIRAVTPPWLARGRVDWAEFVLGRGDAVRARELATSSLDAVGDLDLPVIRRRAEAVLAATS